MNKPAHGSMVSDRGNAGTALIVAGMHRSGTSALAGILSLLGAAAPKTLMRPGADNPKGFWESTPVANLNDDLLARFGSSWDDVLAFMARRDELKREDGVLERIEQVLGSEFPPGGTAVIKDPRISLLLDVWVAAVARRRFSPRVLIAVRNPLEVAASLGERNGISTGRALLLWLSHFLAAERSSRETSRVFVHYQDVLEDWRGALRRAERLLDFQLPGWSPAAELEVDSFLSERDRHQVSSLQRVHARDDVARWVKEAYDLALEAVSVGAADEARLDAVEREFRAYTAIFAPVIAEQRLAILSERGGRISAEASLDRSEQESAALGSQRDAAEADLRARQLQVLSLERSLAERDARIAAFDRDAVALEERAGSLEETLHARDLQLDEILSRLRDHQARGQELEHALAERDVEATALRAQLDEAERGLRDHQAHGQALEHALAEREVETATLRAQLDEAVSSLRANQEFVQSLEHAMVERAAQVVALRSRLDETTFESHGHQERWQNAERVLAERDAEVAALCARLDEAMSELRARHLEVRTLADREAASDARATLSAEAVQTAEARVGELEADLRERAADMARLRQELADRMARLADRQAAVALLEEHVRALEASVRGISSRVRAEQEQRQRLEQVAAAQAAFIERSPPAARRLRNALWRLPPLRPFSHAIEFISISLNHGAVNAAKMLHAASLLRKSGHFDSNYYVARYWDVAASGQDPILHYLLTGAAEGRDPSANFSTSAYLSRYPDVAQAKRNPLLHYVRFGLREGRAATAALAVEASDPLEGSAAPDPYSLRPDDRVLNEARRGHDFMTRSGLLGDEPDWAGAVAALNAAAPHQAEGSAPEVSIIIPVYGQLAFTLNCLDSLQRHRSKFSFETIVVDDLSPDATRAWVGRLRAVRLHARTKNGGFIAACNDGARQSRGRWLVFLNNDTRVADGWLDALIESFSTLHDAEIVGSKLFYPDGSLQEAGGIIWRDGSAWNYGRNDDSNRPEYCYARRVDYVSGASLALSRQVWDGLGGFDTRYMPAYGEDSDICLKVRYLRGKEVWVQPASRVIHYEGKTSGTDLTQGMKAHQAENAKRLFEMWGGALANHRANADDPHLEKDRGVQRRALVIDATTPDPKRDAGSVTCVGLIRALQDAGYKVTFVAEDNLLFMPEASGALQALGVEVLYWPYVKSLEAALDLRGAEFDVVLVFRVAILARRLQSIRRNCPQARLIFHSSDLHFLREERHAQLTGRSAADALETRERELDAVNAVDATVVHSTYERDLLSALAPAARVYVFPWILDPVGRTAPFAARANVGFLGGYGHPPNVDAVLYFTERIWPIIHARKPAMKFIVAGSACPAELTALHGNNNIEVIGFVDDLEAFFGGLRLSVAPIRYGAGIKGKVAMSLAHGVPAVVTGCAAEGMGLSDGDAVLIEDDERAFAEAVLALYDDEPRWLAMSDKGLSFVRSTYGASLARQRIEELLALAGAAR